MLNTIVYLSNMKFASSLVILHNQIREWMPSAPDRYTNHYRQSIPYRTEATFVVIARYSAKVHRVQAERQLLYEPMAAICNSEEVRGVTDGCNSCSLTCADQ